MAEITRYPFIRHFRGSSTAETIVFRDGKVRRSGAGLTFWFHPLRLSVAEIPLDDREVPFLFHARTSDFQDIAVQGSLVYRVVEARTLARRVDFTIDLATGRYVRTPLEQLAEFMVQLAQQSTLDQLAQLTLNEALAQGLSRIRNRISTADELAELTELGIRVIAVRVSSVQPTSALERALETPTLELIQQQADEATFERRAQAVQKERSIAENELQNEIELARQRERLVKQTSANEQLKQTGIAEAKRITVQASADETDILSQAEARRVEVVDRAHVQSERERIDIYRDLPTSVVVALTAQEFAQHMPNIDHLNIGSEQLMPMLLDLMSAQTRKLTSEQ